MSKQIMKLLPFEFRQFYLSIHFLNMVGLYFTSNCLAFSGPSGRSIVGGTEAMFECSEQSGGLEA